MKFKLEKQKDPDQLENEITAKERELEARRKAEEKSLKVMKEQLAKQREKQAALMKAEQEAAKQKEQPEPKKEEYNQAPVGNTPELQPTGTISPQIPQPQQYIPQNNDCSFTTKWKVISVLALIAGLLGAAAFVVMIIALTTAPSA